MLAETTSDDGNFSSSAGPGTGGPSVWVNAWLASLKNF